MTFHSTILGFTLASAVALAAGSAHAGDNGAQEGNQWTGFYGGVSGGIGRSDDAKDIPPFDGKTSATKGFEDLTGGQEAYDAGGDPFPKGLEGEIGKSFTFEKAK
jgi:hypothetical protein